MKTTEEKMNEQRKAIVSKEERAKAESDAKLLGTAMQQLLPEIFIKLVVLAWYPMPFCIGTPTKSKIQ